KSAASTPPGKITMCHATGSSSNPYVKISIPADDTDHMACTPHAPNGKPDVLPGVKCIYGGTTTLLSATCNGGSCKRTDQCNYWLHDPAHDYLDTCERVDCVSGVCVVSPIAASAAQQCHAAAGDCDKAEFCDGTHSDCPADGFQPSG